MKLLLLLALFSLPCYAQQDNRISGNMTFNINDQSHIEVTDITGAKVVITVTPDPNVGARHDAMAACSAALLTGIGLFAQFFAKYPTDSSWWVNPMKDAQTKLTAAKAQADAILALP